MTMTQVALKSAPHVIAVAEEIDKLEADRLLANAAKHPEIRQRKVNGKKLKKIMRDIEHGDTGLSDSCVTTVFAANGDEVPINGIHRLTAISRTGVSMLVLVLRSGDIVNRRFMDKNAVRTPGQQLTMEYDIDQSSSKVAVLRAMSLLEQDGKVLDFSDAELANKITKPLFQSANQALGAIRKGTRCTTKVGVGKLRSDAALAVFVLAYPQDPERVKALYRAFLRMEFFDKALQPIQRMSEVIREGVSNISSASGRLPFIEKAIVLIEAVLAGRQCKESLDLNQEKVQEKVQAARELLLKPWSKVLSPDEVEADQIEG